MRKVKTHNKSEFDISSNGIYTLWHSFTDYLTKYYYSLGHRVRSDSIERYGKFKFTKRKYKFFDISKVIGYGAMCKISEFIKENPDIREVKTDDSHHMGASLYLIPHENKEEYWGTTVLFVPQCHEQNNFFLYPDHLEKLIEELTKLHNRFKEKGEENA